MGDSQFPNEQQAEAPPPQKYELPEEDLKAGLLKRFSVGPLISGVFVLLKDILFGWVELVTARADSVINIDPGNKNIGPPSLVLIETPEPIDQGALGQKPSPNPSIDPNHNRATTPGTSIDSFSTVEQPIYAGPVQVRLSSGRPLAATNDNELVGPAVGSDVNDLPRQVGSGIAGSGRGNGRGGFNDTPKSDGDTATDDPRPTGNRAPVVTRPARLNNLLVDQTVIIATAGLLQNVTDADDGDGTIFGGDGNDVILGENGQDLVFAGAGDEIVDGGTGDDQFIATVSDGNDSHSGGAGTDTYDLSGTKAGVVVYLALGTADGAEIGHDNLSGIENVVGRAGDDVFKASELFNVFTGGEGNDIFEFGGILNANAIGVVRDQFTDFQVGDKIDLRTGKVEVRYQGFGEDERTVVEVKIDDNGEFEPEIELHGRHDLTKDDFIGVR